MTRDRGCGVVCAHFVAGVDLGERLALVDGVGALLQANDADGVVDRILLGPTTGAEMQRGEPDRERREPLDVPAPRAQACRRGPPTGPAASRWTCPLRAANTSRMKLALGSAASSGSPPC